MVWSSARGARKTCTLTHGVKNGGGVVGGTQSDRADRSIPTA